MLFTNQVLTTLWFSGIK